MGNLVNGGFTAYEKPLNLNNPGLRRAGSFLSQQSALTAHDQLKKHECEFFLVLKNLCFDKQP